MPNVKILLLNKKMIVSPVPLKSPFCCTNTNITVRQSKSIEDREIGKQFAPLWRELAYQLKVLFPGRDDEGAPSHLRFFAAWPVEAPFSAVSGLDGFYTLCYLCLDAEPCMVQHLSPGKVLCKNVSARARHCRVSSFLPCGFRATNPYWCRRPIPLATGCSPSITADYTTYYRLGCMWPFPFRRPAVHYVEHQRSLWICFFANKRTESSNANISISSLTPTTFYVSRRYMVRDEHLQAIQVLAPRFKFLGTFIPENENAGGSAICTHTDLLPEGAIVSHVITGQGLDHFVNIQSGRHNLVIVNVHFEPELTLRQLRGRLRLIHPHWPAYPSGVGIIFG